MKEEEKDAKYFAELAYPALYRAAMEVAEDAEKKGIKIPIWRNGKMVYGLPRILEDKTKGVKKKKLSIDKAG